MNQRNYMTQQKKELLAFLELHSERHFTIEQIAGEMDGIGKSTVYRLIAKLVADGTVRRFEAPKAKAFVYQFAGKENSCDCHFHLKCAKCGRLIHMECDRLSAVKEHIANEHNFLIGADCAVLYGECTSCHIEEKL